MTTVRRSLVSLVVAAIITALIYVLIVNGLRNPVDGRTADYPAVFSDASGLRIGADVRRQGVQVGKVTGIEVIRNGDTNVARVHLDLSRKEHVSTATRLAIKFQNLTGSRYVDIRETDQVTNPAPIKEVPLAQTTGSFDITTIFRGLEPVLRTLEPADINNLTEKLAIFLDGDGVGSADLFDAIRTLAAGINNKQQVIRTIVDNLTVFMTKLKGQGSPMVKSMVQVNILLDSMMPQMENFRKMAGHGPQFFGALNRLLWIAGLRDGNDLDERFDVMKANLYRIPEFFERLPGAYSGLQPMLKTPGADLNCINGRLTLPPMVKVFLDDEQVVLCNR